MLSFASGQTDKDNVEDTKCQVNFHFLRLSRNTMDILADYLFSYMLKPQVCMEQVE